MIYTHIKRKDLMNTQNPLDIVLQKTNNLGNEKQKKLLSGNI